MVFWWASPAATDSGVMTIPKLAPIQCLRTALFTTMVVLLAPALQGNDVKVEELTRSSATEIVLRFNDADPGMASDYAVESSPALSEGSWTALPSLAVSTGPTSWQITATLPEAAAAAFFRITKDGVPLTATLQGDLTAILEGESNPGLTVQFTGPFTGDLFYSVDYLDGNPPVAGSIAVAGATSARIPITVAADDDETNPDGRVTVSLRTSGSGDYGLGNLGSVTLSLIDNDSYWDGVLEESSGGPTFSFRMVNQGGTLSAEFVGSGTNMFPSGVYAVSDPSFAPGGTFSGTTSPITIPGDSTPTGEDVTLTISFAASDSGNEEDDQLVGNDLIVGTYTLTQAVPDKAFLDQSRTGTFRLLRRIIVTTPSP